MAFELSSAAFADGGTIPQRHSCEGAGRSVPLAWSGAPAGTRSFALVCEDPDAPGGTFYHWAVWNIPADRGELEEGYPAGPEVGPTRQGINDFGRHGYGPPCPPPGHGAHRYRFKLFALAVESLALTTEAKVGQVEHMAEASALERAELTGTYAR